MTTRMTREAYIEHLAAKYEVARGEIVEAVDAALASHHITRWGRLSDASIAAAWERGEGKPSPGPYQLDYQPRRPFWIERNTYERVEYSTRDLDLKTSECRKNWLTKHKERAPSRNQDEVNEMLRAELERCLREDRQPLKDARKYLRSQRISKHQIKLAIEATQEKGLLQKRGERPLKSII
jgi:hypothetical protein